MGIAASIMRVLIRCYQLTLASFCMGSCRFLPSCSHYAMEAVEVHGAWKGGWLALRRLLRCHPWGSDGYDPVPPAAATHACCGHEGENTPRAKALAGDLFVSPARSSRVETR